MLISFDVCVSFVCTLLMFPMILICLFYNLMVAHGYIYIYGWCGYVIAETRDFSYFLISMYLEFHYFLHVQIPFPYISLSLYIFFSYSTSQVGKFLGYN
jgi:hypothetical protein